MGQKRPPEICPSCGLEGSLVQVGNGWRCLDDNCGHWFPIYPKYGPDGPPKRIRKPTKKADTK